MRKGSKLSAEHRAKISASMRGIKRSAEHRAKISASLTGRKLSPLSAEHRAKISASMRGKKHSAEARAKISASKTGKKHSAEARAKISASKTGKKRSAETRAKISANHVGMKGRKHSAETRAKISANNARYFQGKKHSAETRAKVSASMRGIKRSAEHRAKISASNKGQIPWNKGKTGIHSPESIAKMSAYANKPEVLEKSRERRLHTVIPDKDTKLELKLQELLKANNIQFTKHRPILGQPDIFIEPNICIFADGDYWHGWFHLQGENYSKQSKFNNEYFEKQIKRDQSVKARLEAQGYKVLRLWEHEIIKEPKKCLDRIRALL